MVASALCQARAEVTSDRNAICASESIAPHAVMTSSTTTGHDTASIERWWMARMTRAPSFPDTRTAAITRPATGSSLPRAAACSARISASNSVDRVLMSACTARTSARESGDPAT
ncbi:Uncharacterised protein [Mycobacteroides abscessus subsp. abscessus]|nr:Uncharacterised protein [Mycobacteroides abscessus subsp. abscessus]